MPGHNEKFEDWNIWLGVVLLILGSVVIYISSISFEELPNYLRLASLIPFMLAFPAFSFKQYAKWNELSWTDKWWLVRFTIPAAILIPGSLLWMIFSPETRD